MQRSFARVLQLTLMSRQHGCLLVRVSCSTLAKQNSYDKQTDKNASTTPSKSETEV